MTILETLFLVGCPAPAPPPPPIAAPPASPAAAALAPCPPGWREIAGDGTATNPAVCDPWPAGGPAACAADEAHFPGEPGCSRIGSACALGAWPEGLPTDRPVLYVRAGAAGGDGSMGAPFGRIRDATLGAAPGTVIALGPGTFDEPVWLPAGVTLWGACVAGTTVTSSVPSDFEAVVNVGAAGAEVRNLTIRGERPGVIAASSAASVHLEDVVLAQTRMIALWLQTGATLTGHTVVARDTQPRLGFNDFGRGLALQEASYAEIHRAVFERNHDYGVWVADPGSTLLVTDAAVRDTRSDPSLRRFGRGLSVEYCGSARADRVVLEGNREYALFATDPGSTLILDDVVARDTLGGEATLLDGRGLSVQVGAHVEVNRGLFERNQEIGVYASGSATIVTLTDVVVRDTRGRDGDQDGGRGLNVQWGARLSLARGLVANNREFGVFVANDGSSVSLTDIVVRDTQPHVSLRWGRGIDVSLGAHLDASRVRVAGNRDIGILAAGAATTLVLADAIVEDTAGRQLDGSYGGGLHVQEGVQATIDRAVFRRNRGAAVLAADAPTSLVMTDLEVTDTFEMDCAAGACAGAAAGTGLVAATGAAIDVRRFVVSRGALSGVAVVRGGAMDLHEGEIADNPIGANVQTAGFDIQRLNDHVVYRNNDRNLDAGTLPTSDPTAALGTLF